MPSPTPPLRTLEIPLEQIAVIGNIRAERGICELAASLAAHGLLVPVRVRPAAADAEHGCAWEIVHGHRRLAAARKLAADGAAGWQTIRAEAGTVADEQLPFVQFEENEARDDMTPVEIAQAIKQMTGTRSQTEVAKGIGKDDAYVSRALRIERMPEQAKQRIVETGLSLSAAGELARVDDEQVQLQLLEQAARNNQSVAKIRDNVRAYLDDRANAEAAASAGALDTQPGALTLVQPADVVPLPALNLREGLDQAMHVRIAAYALLRNGLNQWLLDWLEQQGFPWERLWEYVRALADDEVQQLLSRLAVDYITDAHRFTTLEPALIDDLAVPGEPFVLVGGEGAA
jgi:ParB/RepB/Spo0J family partition protein